MRAEIRLFCLAGALLGLAASLCAGDRGSELYEEMLKTSHPAYQMELLREFRARGEKPSPIFTELFLKSPAPGLREVLIAETPLDFMRGEEWFRKVPPENLGLTERIALWKRATVEPQFFEVFNLGEIAAKCFAKAEDSERGVILDLLRAAGSPALLENIKASPGWESDPPSLRYILDFAADADLSRLAVAPGESSLTAMLKMRILKKLGGRAGIAGFDASENPVVRRSALEDRDEEIQEKALSDPSAWVRAGAVGGLMKKRWRADLAERFLAGAVWVELEQVLQGMLANRAEIHAPWVETAWNKSSREGKFVLGQFLAEEPRSEWWELMTGHFEREDANRSIILRAMLHMKPESRSDWLLSLVEKNVMSDGDTALAFYVLYAWSEKLDGELCVKIFKQRSYSKGGPGGGYLLKLIGKSQVKSGVDIIRQHLRHYLENPYAMEVVEAAGWNASPAFENGILAFYNSGFNNLKDPTGIWAVKKCRGVDGPLPPRFEPPARIPVLSMGPAK